MSKKEIKLIECPNCKSTHLKIILFNQFKKKHYYLIWCSNCDWSQKFKHSWAFNAPSKCFENFLLQGGKPSLSKEELKRKGWLNE